MPLNLTVFNQFYAINKICGQEKQRHYLELSLIHISEPTRPY